MSRVADLFTEFRREHPRGTRVPKALRAEALAALKAGAAPGDLYRSCGLTFGQVAAWKANDLETTRVVPSTRAGAEGPARGASPAAAPESVRTFNVNDTTEALGAGSELELRLGAWSVVVRLAGRGSGESR